MTLPPEVQPRLPRRKSDTSLKQGSKRDEDIEAGWFCTQH